MTCYIDNNGYVYSGDRINGDRIASQAEIDAAQAAAQKRAELRNVEVSLVGFERIYKNADGEIIRASKPPKGSGWVEITVKELLAMVSD